MATSWAVQMDPAEELEFVMDFGGASSDEAVLDVDNAETIDTFEVAVSPEGAALGLTIMTANGRDPVKVQADTAIQVWLSVAPGSQADAAFDGAGIALGVVATIVTDSVPARTRQRTWEVTVAQL